MKSFLIRVVVNAVAIWVATIVVDGISVNSPGDSTASTVLTYLVIGAIFGLVNAFVKPIVRLFAFPFYVLTLGLLTFVVNAAMLELTAWISGFTGLTLSIDQFFWDAVFGALVVTLVSMVLNLVLPDGDD
jgi:putative membrane protein